MENKDRVRAVLITGTICSGKTAVATEMGEILRESAIPNAVVDLDWLGWVHLGPEQEQPIDGLIAVNLAAILPNYRSAGVLFYLFARSIRTMEQVAALQRALGEPRLVVVRLTASHETIFARLSARDEGEVLEEHLTQAVEFATDQAEAGLADIEVSNDARPIRDVAAEVLVRLGWLD